MADKKNPISEAGSGAQSRTLGLAVPKQVLPPQDCILLDPQETSEWISALPLANIGETARQVYTTLVDFNRYEMPEVVRAKVVELFRPTVDYVCHNLRRHYMDMGFPLSPKAWKTIILSRELYNELATSYKVIVERTLSGTTERFDRKLLVIALHRAFYYLSRVHHQACLGYASAPPGLWKELNAIFAFARQNKVHRVPVKMKRDKTEEISTIEERYKAMMLFAAGNPSRLRQSQLNNTFEKSLEWAPQARFLGMDDDIPGIGSLNINLGADEGPIHNALRMPIPGRRTAILDLRDLIRKLHDEYEQAPLDGANEVNLDKSRISRALLRQLIRGWHSPPDRQYVRTQLHFSLKVLCGLRPIHSELMLGGSDSGDSIDSPSEMLTGLSTSPNVNTLPLPESTRGNPLDNIDDSMLSLAPAPSKNDGDSLLMETKGPFDRGPYDDGPVNEWRESRLMESDRQNGLEVTTRNESAGGYCIRWSTKNHPPKVKIGELLGIGGSGTHPNYSLGVIRWMHNTSEAELDLGLQVISSHVAAAQAYEATARGKVPLRKRENPIMCLLLDADSQPTRKGGPSIVFASAAHAVDTHLWMDDSGSGEPRLIRLTRLIDFSSVYARFEFEFIMPDSSNSLTHDEEAHDEFESLWNAL